MHLIFLLLLSVVAACVSAVLVPLVVAARLAAGLWRWLRALSSPPCAPNYPPLSSYEIEARTPLVVVIHGTFARDAAWTKPGSSLHRRITAAIEARGTGCIWHRLGWSEANLVRDRLEAIAELRRLLARVFARHPDRDVVLIGHSHGGGIALKASEDFADRQGLSIVTLATPFLMAQPRPSLELLSIGLPLIHVVAMTLLCGVVVDRLSSMPWVTWTSVAATLITGILFLPRGYRAVAADREELLRSVPDIERLAPLRDRTLVVSRAGDEADGGLKLVSLANGWISSTMSRAGFFDYAARVAVHLRQLWQLHRVGGPLSWAEFGRIGRDLVPPRYSVVVLDLLAVWSGLLLLELLQKAVGTRTAIVSAGVTLSSSETPPGIWLHLQSLPSTLIDSDLLSHSQIYSDDELLGDISRWLIERLPGGSVFHAPSDAVAVSAIESSPPATERLFTIQPPGALHQKANGQGATRSPDRMPE